MQRLHRPPVSEIPGHVGADLRDAFVCAVHERIATFIVLRHMPPQRLSLPVRRTQTGHICRCRFNPRPQKGFECTSRCTSTEINDESLTRTRTRTPESSA